MKYLKHTWRSRAGREHQDGEAEVVSRLEVRNPDWKIRGYTNVFLFGQ